MLLCLYWFLVIVCGGFIILTFVVGELADLGENALDSVGDTISHALDGLFGAAEVGEVDLPDVPAVDLDVDAGPSPFSLRTIMMFAAGFGAGGLVGNGLGWSEPLTLIPAFGFGAVAGTITWFFLRFLYSEQASTSIQPSDYIGLIGRVTVSIPKGRLGQVMVDVKLQKRRLPARSEDGAAIPAQTQVEIVSMEGGVLIVKTLA